MAKRQHALLLFIIIAVFTATAEVTNGTSAMPSISRLSCGFYQRGPEDASILDCRQSGELEAYSSAGYNVRRKIFVPVGGAAAWHGRPVWTLSPPLSGEEAINSLPTDAFLVGRTTTEAAVKLDEVDALSLRRLHQPAGLNLKALHRLRKLSRLELAETNATCLQRDLFVAPTWISASDSRLADRLVSLHLTGNADLICIQIGALDALVNLAELSIRGSPRLKSLGGAPALPALVRLELPTSMAKTLADDVDVAFCHVGVSLRYLTIDSGLSLLWKPTPSLANITSLRVEPSPDEAIEAIVQRLVLRHQAALCSVWPSGHLQLNGLQIADLVTDQLGMDYATEFCAYIGEAVIEYTEHAQLRCSITNSSKITVCDDVCQSTQPPLPLPPSSAPTMHNNPTATSIDSAPNRRDDTENRKTTGEAVGEATPGLDREGVIGTALLTAGAFMGGALIAAYCCHSRRRMAAAARLKLVGAATITGCPATASSQSSGGKNGNGTAANGSAATKTTVERGDMEQIRLIGYTAGLGDSGSRVVVFKEVANNAAMDATVTVKIVDEADEVEGDDSLLTAQL